MTTGLMHRGLESAAHQFPDHPALLTAEERWTFGELDRASNAAARHLAVQGVATGDRVAVMTSNRAEFVAAVHAVSKLGASSVLLNPAWKEIEVGTALGLTAPRYAVADGPGVGLLSVHVGAGVLDLEDDRASAVFDRTSTVPPPVPTADLSEGHGALVPRPRPQRR
jgi:acyl-CoA synthetase (AMP-forming)/AMP-acid ligase II